jgi:hypothetical protein
MELKHAAVKVSTLSYCQSLFSPSCRGAASSANTPLKFCEGFFLNPAASHECRNPFGGGDRTRVGAEDCPAGRITMPGFESSVRCAERFAVQGYSSIKC